MESFIVVLVTAKDENEAARIAHALVDKKMAACCNIIKGVRSIYGWEGAVQDEAETLLLVKTRKGLFDQVRAEVKRLHSYSTPEIIAVDITAGDAAYLEWLSGSTR